MSQHRMGGQEELADAAETVLDGLGALSGRPAVQRIVADLRFAMLDRVLAAVYQRQGDVLSLLAQAGYDDVCDQIPLGSGVVGRVAASQKSELVDLATDSRVIGSHSDVTSMVCAPAGPELVLTVESAGQLSGEDVAAIGRLAADLGRRFASTSASASNVGQALIQLAKLNDRPLIVELACRTIARVVNATTARAIVRQGGLDEICITWRKALTTVQPPSTEQVVFATASKAEELDASTIVVPFEEAGVVIGGVLAHADTARLSSTDRSVLADIGRVASARLEGARETEELKNALIARSEFTRAVSHEFRTPLTAIVGYADLILESAHDAEETEEFVGAIRRNGAHLIAMVTDLLDIARSDAGQLAVRNEPCVDIADVVGGALDLTNPQALQESVTRTVNVEPGVTASGDSLRIRQIIVNVLANAIKFAPGGEVVINAHARNDTVVVEVADNGEGMTVEELAGLFMPFSGRSVRDPRSGTGLGLVISRRLAEAMGGTLELASGGPGQGTSATLTLPLADC